MGREFSSPFRNGKISGDQVWEDTVRLWDELNGTKYFHAVDELERRMYQAGMLGFSPRNWEAAQAMQLYQRGWSMDKIKESVQQIGRYGIGRSAAEKSANFVFFPFSFSKKMLTTMGDFALQRPGRAFLISETLRRYYESGADDQFHDFVEKHVPLLTQLSRINNLAFGISPGRFFLAGLGDNRSNEGKAAFILSQFFAPGGATTALAQGAGATGDWARQAFAPIVLTGESMDRAGSINNLFDVVNKYIPFARELNQYWTAAKEQKTALTEGGSPWSQFQEFSDQKRAAKAEFEPLAMAFGYQSVDGFLGSDIGAPFKLQLDNQEQQLMQEYPTAASMSRDFTNIAGENEAMMYELEGRPTKTPGEEAILGLMEQIKVFQTIKDLGILDADTIDMMAGQQIRNEALKYAGDARFQELYERFFAREYGPIRRVA
jgi:hypothetical protein